MLNLLKLLLFLLQWAFNAGIVARIHALFFGLDRAYMRMLRTMVHMVECLGTRITSDQPKIEPYDLILANHQSWFDSIVGMRWTIDCGCPIMIVAKDMVRYLPINGWWIRKMKFPLISRTSKDRDQLNTIVTSNPVAIFPEGSRYTSLNHARAKLFAAKNGIECGDRTILPRSGGAYTLMMNELRETIHIRTIVYNGGTEFPYRRLWPRSVDVTTRSYKRRDIPLATEAEFRDWLRARFLEMSVGGIPPGPPS